jgi:hypothetical protein
VAVGAGVSEGVGDGVGAGVSVGAGVTSSASAGATTNGKIETISPPSAMTDFNLLTRTIFLLELVRAASINTCGSDT